MNNVSIEVKILRKNTRKCYKKKTVTEMKNTLDGLISRLDTAKERISKCKDVNRKFTN